MVLYHILQSNSRTFRNLASQSRRRRVYHPQLVAVYHQHEVLYIIKPQEDARWRVMKYSPKGADDMHHASRGDDMQSLREPPKLGKLASGNPYCGLDKKIRILSNADFL